MLVCPLTITLNHLASFIKRGMKIMPLNTQNLHAMKTALDLQACGVVVTPTTFLFGS
jgi:hypothetical protein